MATPSIIPTDASRDNVVRLRRVTRESRQLWYQLTVLQQPERARACGAGTKANSDRRPVDPPPVVELKIKEGNSFEEGKEITFDYNASFFLYASLEQSRKIAQGRLPGQPNPPILTGVPASGMAYLDRPAAAGYFIFPDLSVRHEGNYRLSFSLFETTKEEKDFDLEPHDSDLPSGVDWRMEIKTAPFDVFSAKKFPGLSESTQLSKDVADQGCRVRIRREVRMRKREGKSNGRDRREEDFSRRRTVTPAPEDPRAAAARARSMSNSSEHRVPYGNEPQLRPSGVDSYPPPPPPPQSSYEPAGSRHLAFGGDSSSQYAAPRQYSHQSLPPVSPNGPFTPTSQYVKTESQSYPYPPARNVPYPCPSPTPRHEGHDRRQSTTYMPPSPSVYSSVDGHTRHGSNSSQPSTPVSSLHSGRGLAPIRPQLAPMKINALLVTDMIEAQTEPLPVRAPTPVGSKRKLDSAFTQSSRPLFNHQRPKDPHYGGGYGIRIENRSEDTQIGEYKRASGVTDTVRFSNFYP